MRDLTYFVSDVHLGLDVSNPSDREARFVRFLRSIDKERTGALYLLGDIWDFWYEYDDVVPKGYVRVFAALMDLMDAGVEVYFFQGNHDIWTYRYFEEMGMKKLQQPCFVEISGKRFCIGHGDGLGPGDKLYKLMRWGFRNRCIQWLFSLLHPYIAFRLGNGWSKSSRLAKNYEYEFRGEDEPLYKWCMEHCGDVDYFIFGHYHCRVDMPVGDARLMILKDWMKDSPYIKFNGISVIFGYSPNKAQ